MAENRRKKTKANYKQIKIRWFSATYFFFGFTLQIKHTANLQKSLRIDEFRFGGTIIHIEHKNTSETKETASTTILHNHTHSGIFIFFFSIFFFLRKGLFAPYHFALPTPPAPSICFRLFSYLFSPYFVHHIFRVKNTFFICSFIIIIRISAFYQFSRFLVFLEYLIYCIYYYPILYTKIYISYWYATIEL